MRRESPTASDIEQVWKRIQDQLDWWQKHSTRVDRGIQAQLNQTPVQQLLMNGAFHDEIRRLVQAGEQSLKGAIRKKGALRARHKRASKVRKRLAYARKTLGTLRSRVVAVQKDVGKWLSPKGISALDDALQRLEDAAWHVTLTERTATEFLPLTRRESHYATSPWPSLIETTLPELPKLENKIREHRLWEKIDNKLTTSLPPDVSRETRYVVIATLLAVFSDGWVQPSTIKQSFYTRTKRKPSKEK